MQDAAVEKRCLIQLLDDARQDTLATLKQIDPELVVHPHSHWRVKDVVGHLAFWEEEAMRSLLALRDSRIYTIAEFVSFDATNEEDYRRRRDQSFTSLLNDLRTVRERLKAALWAMPPGQFSGMMRFPWPWVGSLGELIETMAAHEREHLREIRAAVARAAVQQEENVT
jgi:hypothetical protein